MLAIKGSWGAADLAAFIRCYHGTYVKLLRLSTSWGVEWQGSAGGAGTTRQPDAGRWCVVSGDRAELGCGYAAT
jgi:hypothetical protein